MTAADAVRQRLDEISARAEEATEGPWSAADEHGLLGPDATPAWCVSRMRPGYEEMSETEGYLYDICYVENTNEQADAEFIAAARSDVPALVAVVEAVLNRHQPVPLYDECPHACCGSTWETTDGDMVCGDPIGEACDSCRDEDGKRMDWPCDEFTRVAAALGVSS